MKKNLLFLPILIFILGIQLVSAQSDEQKLISDMLLVADKFAAPGAEGAALQSSAGWFTSGTTLGKWKFEVSLHGNALFIPSQKQNKFTSSREFQILRFQDGENAVLPTVFGGETDVVFEGELTFENPLTGGMETLPFNFDAIDGLDKSVVIHPFPQVTIGLPYSTEVAVRFLPSVTVNDVNFSTYGIGLKHNFTQYYERRFNKEDFQFSAAVTYSNFKADYALDQISIPVVLMLNQINVNADLWLFQALGSKLYGSFEVFGALGVTASNFNYEVGGGGSELGRLNEALTGISGNGTQFKGDVGFNYYAGKFKISTMLTASNFFNANLGIHYRI